MLQLLRGLTPEVRHRLSREAGRSSRGTTRPGRRAAREGGAAAAGLLDDQLDAGVVPELRAPRRSRCRALPPRRGSAARSRREPRLAQALSGERRPARGHVAVPTSSRSTRPRPARPARRGTARPFGPGAPAAHRPPAAAERRRRDERDLDHARRARARAASPRRARRARSCACRRSGRRSTAARPRRRPRAPRRRTPSPLPRRLATRSADRLLGRPVGLGHRRQVGFRLDPQVERPKARQRDRVGGVGELVREAEVRAHGPPRYRSSAASSARPAARTSASLPGRPTSWTDAGKPVLRRPARQRQRGPAEQVERVGEPDEATRASRSRRCRPAARRSASVGVSSRSNPSSAASAARS